MSLASRMFIGLIGGMVWMGLARAQQGINSPQASRAQQVRTQQAECAQTSDREQLDCLAQKIRVAETQLDEVYQAALAKMPASDPTDDRKSRAQLAKAQTAWKRYVDANCAYAGGADGGSNQWVTNFAERCHLHAVLERTAFLARESGFSSVQEASGHGPSSPLANLSPQMPAQQVLDLLAKPPTPAPRSLPTSYLDWSDEQRKAGPGQVRAQCVALRGMANDSKPVKLLPPGQDSSDGPKLAIEVCVLSRMPVDWPERGTVLADARRIVQRASDLGAPLRLPAAAGQ